MLDVNLIIDSEGLYMTTFPDGRSFKWRLLTMKEYKAFRAIRGPGMLHPHIVHEKVFERCYIGHYDLISGDIPAGWTISLGELIMHMSGDTSGISDRMDLENARKFSNSFLEYMKRVILRAFPSYTLETFDGWSRKKLFDRFVFAENLLHENGSGYKPIELKDILTPEEHEKRSKRKGIDFKGDNAALDGVLGSNGQEDLIDLPPEQFNKKMKIAQAMSKRNMQRSR